MTTNGTVVAGGGSLVRELEAERRKSVELAHSVNQLQQELKHTKAVSQSLCKQVEEEEEYITNAMLKRLQELKSDSAALAKEVEAEEDFLVNTLHRKLARVHLEKADLEARLSEEQESANNLSRRLNQLSEERQRLLKERADLENVLEAEQEYICNRLNKQVTKLASEKAALQREKAELQRQVEDLNRAVDRSRREKVELENALEQEEEAVVNRLQRQLQQVTTAYRALEARAEAHGLTAKEHIPIDATTEWVYGRLSRASADRLSGSRRERSLSVSSTSSMRGGVHSEDIHHSGGYHPILGQRTEQQQHYGQSHNPGDSPVFRNRPQQPSTSTSQAPSTSSSSAALIQAMNAQTL